MNSFTAGKMNAERGDGAYQCSGDDERTHVDEQWYLDRYPDVARSGLTAFAHYISYGQAEGRFPNKAAEELSASIAMLSGLVDKDWYASRYADVAQSGIDPGEHFALYGHKEGRYYSASDPRYQLAKTEIAEFNKSFLLESGVKSELDGIRQCIPAFLNAASTVPALANKIAQIERRITEIEKLLNQPNFK
jgi:hypothetical protein